MKALAVSAILIVFSGHLFATDFRVDESIHDGDSVSFLSHQGLGRWDNYLTMNLPFEPMADLFKQLLLNKRKQLTNRGEAHITVVTPIEYWNILRPKNISMDEINEIALEQGIQSSNFKIKCLGVGTANINNKTEETYYVVVKSTDLIKIRRKIQDLLAFKKGDPSLFDPKDFYPHITLGFTSRDLHESDGVIKSTKSCKYNIQEVDKTLK